MSPRRCSRSLIGSTLSLLLLVLPACGGSVDDGGLGGGDGNGGGSGGGGNGNGDGSGSGGSACEQVEPIQLTPGAPPDILLVVDKSGSMKEDLGSGQQKWPVMRDALDTVVGQYQGGIQFGLMLFPQGSECDAGTVRADIAVQNGGAISNELQNTRPDGGTPTHTTLAAALSYYQGVPPAAGGQYVLLATDGEPNCGDPNDDQAPTVTESISAINGLKSASIKTFVLGFGGTVNNHPDTLQRMAQAGGTGDYFAANSPDDLATALDAIASAVGFPSCSFRLNQTPDDPSLLSVFEDSDQIQRDQRHQDGWDYNANTNTITFYGASCDAIHGGSTDSVRIEFGGCGDSGGGGVPD